MCSCCCVPPSPDLSPPPSLPPSSLLRYGGSMSLQSAMSVRFNSTGTQLLALRRRLPPVLYELHSRLPSFQFDNQGYFNSCTMKSCCFAGDKDQVGRWGGGGNARFGKRRRACVCVTGLLKVAAGEPTEKQKFNCHFSKASKHSSNGVWKL